MSPPPALPSAVRFVIIGAGFAGASTAWALARLGLGPGAILEREDAVGVHASGRNAGLCKISEDDGVVRALVVRSLGHLGALAASTPDLFRSTGGLTLGPPSLAPAFDGLQRALAGDGIRSERLSPAAARQRAPLLERVSFDEALWCPVEGVVDVHALLTHYLRQARAGGFSLHTGCAVRDLIVRGGRVVGVETEQGPIEADLVVDAAGAWAGRLGRGVAPLPLQPVRRHLFVSGRVTGASTAMPFVWLEGADLYFRGEGDGLLLSPCDETPADPGMPSVDPRAAEQLADKLAQHAAALGDLHIRRSWACLRTFAPDRRPAIGPDPDTPGLFHVSGLGGFGMMTSAAVGELAAAIATGAPPDWIDASLVSAARAATRRPPVRPEPPRA